MGEHTLPRLNAAGLAEARPGVEKPTYERAGLEPKIVHFGVGGFHRAHMAVAVDDLLQRGEEPWAICGVGLLPHDERMRDVLHAQNGLYTLMLKPADGHRQLRVIGSIVDYVFAPDDPARVIELLTAPSTAIVSLTITEGGYNFDRVSGEFMAHAPGIADDLAEPANPRTVFGFVVEALRLRRERGIPPFTVLSCDNIQSNGDVAKRMFTAFARLRDSQLADWIASTVPFPNSMVDRITPVTAAADVVEVAELLGLQDEWPVVAEPFFQWVLEDHFSLGRPDLAAAGVQLVDDVMPYELMKLRLLNASHQGLTYFGYLMGYRYAHEATGDSLIANFLRAYMQFEATPTLLPVPGIDIATYREQLIERFANPEVKDTLARLCAESSDRIPKWLVPVIHDRLAQGGDVRLSAAIVASWARYAEGVDEAGEPIEVVDALRDELIPIARSQRDKPLAFIANRSLFGALVDDPRFTEPYLAALKSLHEHGARATLAAILERADFDRG